MERRRVSGIRVRDGVREADWKQHHEEGGRSMLTRRLPVCLLLLCLNLCVVGFFHDII